MATDPFDNISTTIRKWVRDTKLARKMYPIVLEEKDGMIYVDTGIEQPNSLNSIFKKAYAESFKNCIPNIVKLQIIGDE
jgi:hypothetical protein